MLSHLALTATAGPSQRIVASFPFLNGERLAIHHRTDGRIVTLVAAGGGLFAVDIGDDLRSPQLATGTFRSQLKFVSTSHDVGGKVQFVATPRTEGVASQPAPTSHNPAPPSSPGPRRGQRLAGVRSCCSGTPL